MEKKVREVKTRGRIGDMIHNEIYEPQLVNIITQMHRQCIKMIPYRIVDGLLVNTTISMRCV